MLETGYFADILWFLFAAVLVSAISGRIKSSPVLGYLIAGVIIGPWGLDLIMNVDSSKSVSELGLIFLFFAIGLGMSFERLIILRKYLFGLGSIQVAVTGVVLGGLLSLLKFQSIEAIVIASSLTLSSTAIVLQLLSESNEVSSRHGRVTFSILLLQDLAAILLLVWVDYLKPNSAGEAQTFTFLSVAISLLKSMGGLALVVVLGRFVIRPIFRFLGDSEQSDLFMAFTLLVILGTSALSERIGVSTEFAAFTVGLLMSDSEFRNTVENVIRSFRGLLLGLFFMGIGMSISIDVLWAELGSILLMLAIFIPIKFVIMYISSRSFGLSHWVSMRISTYIAPGGEFAFVILGKAVLAHIIDPKLADIVVLASALSMMITPLLDKIVKWLMPAEDEQDDVIEEEIA